ncbi:MAG TPA: spermidine/putrescine ABC transporter substrate-binding protein [Halanaerobiales bacterium]|nr:spermidine/putrescine ABC transporter substrate-binding protein [Halanaerobiales bacterium]HPZ63944.1 spermidine/putrescine ABC transporter substrate-binding protein [Halanaerobiales bacterium]
MKKYNRLILSLVLLLTVVLLTACQQDERVVLNVYNWGDYIDESVIQEFEEKYNIRVNYDTFSTNEDMYVKIKAGGADYDVLFPSDYMIERMIKEDMLHKLDFDNIPNYKYIEGQFKNLEYDPQNEYSVPYMWGTVGILYNKTMVEEPVTSWQILWDQKYSKQILMLDSQRDSIGVALKMLGYDMNTRDLDELEAAKQALIEQKPLVLAYVGDDVKDKMIAGEAALAVVWSGDAVYMKWENPDLEYALPEEGSNLWVDAMVIPKTSKNKAEAELFINFMCDPEIAFKNTDYIGYSSPHSEAKKMLDPELLDDPAAYPDLEGLVNYDIFKDLADYLKVYDRIWTEVKAH